VAENGTEREKVQIQNLVTTVVDALSTVDRLVEENCPGAVHAPPPRTSVIGSAGGFGDSQPPPPILPPLPVVASLHNKQVADAGAGAGVFAPPFPLNK
jgi:hypothetical protein